MKPSSRLLGIQEEVALRAPHGGRSESMNDGMSRGEHLYATLVGGENPAWSIASKASDQELEMSRKGSGGAIFASARRGFISPSPLYVVYRMPETSPSQT